MSEQPEIVMPDAELREKLSPEAYEVTQKAHTERPFTSTLNENKATGAYNCVVCGTELFSSEAKFDSGTVCKNCHAHLGHVFPDGPGTSDRYCINGCALEFKEK